MLDVSHVSVLVTLCCNILLGLFPYYLGLCLLIFI